jgi:hypothetical protein
MAQIWLLIEQADLDVEDEAATHLLQRLNYFRIPARRVLLIASNELVLARQHAIAVVFELEYPAGSGERRMIRREHQVNGVEVHTSRACSPVMKRLMSKRSRLSHFRRQPGRPAPYRCPPLLKLD